MSSFILHWMGLDNPASPQYLFWSGVGSFVLTSIAFIIHHLSIRKHITKEARK